MLLLNKHFNILKFIFLKLPEYTYIHEPPIKLDLNT